LAMDVQGDVTIVELKRNRTPRDVTAQVLDYASWVRRLTYKDLDAIASGYLKRDLSAAFSEHFDEGIPESVNVSHRMLIVASEFDDSSQRIVEYLAEEYQANINAIFFSVFDDGHGKILGRAWLLDPEDVQDQSDTRKRAPWSGYWFVNVGESPHRSWNDNVKYGFIGAGQGPKYSGPLKKLREGDEIFAYFKGEGYVGYGVVIQPARMVRDFTVDDDGRTLLDVDLQAPHASENRDDPDLSEWAVGVDWKKTFARNEAQYFKGLFANPNVVCKLRQQETVEFLKTQFNVST